MTTSLAEQLQRLALPQTSVLKRDKKRPSLLFDPKEAATFSRETFYQIGLEGLEELVQKNEAFSQFEDTLFHITSKEFERSIHNTEANEKLNKNLKKFLLLLSPYFMLNCSHKALEWLINRFSIHEYNREDLLMLCLPYHESNIFVKLIQLLKFKDTEDSFYFLKQLQKVGSHLPKQSLLNHSASNSGFLKFVSKYIKELLKTHDKHYLLTVAFNFYCTIFTGTLEYCDEVKEDQVSQMLPLLLKGLNSPTADFCAASYVITARLVCKTSLSPKLLDNFVEKISKVSVQSLKTEACLVLLVIYQSQKHYKSVPPVAIASLSEMEWLPKALYDLQNSGSFIYPFLERLIADFSNEGVNNDMKLARDMVKACLDSLKIKDDFLVTVMHAILDIVQPKMNISSEAKEWLIEIIETLETQYPTLFDREVYNIFSSSKDKKTIKRRKCLSKLLKNTMTYKGKFEIFNKLYHPEPKIRGEALKFLLEDYDNLKENDKELINNCFIDRLRDDDVNVVKETLKVIKKTSKIDKESLKKSLACLAIKYQKDKKYWEVIYKDISNMLLTLYPCIDWEVFLIIFPFLIPSSSEELPKVKKLLETPYIFNNDLFKPNFHKLISTNDTESFENLILKTLAGNTDIQNLKRFEEVLNQLPNESWDNCQKYVSFLILSSLIPINYTLEDGSLVLDFLSKFYDQVEEKFDAEASVAKYIEESIKRKYPVQGFLKCLEILTYKVEKPKGDLRLRDFSTKDSETKFLLIVTKIFLDNVKYLKKFFKKLFKNDEEATEYLLNLCLCENTILDDSFKLKVLAHIKDTLQDSEDVKSWIYLDKCNPVLLLALLSDPDQNIRLVIINIFEKLINLSSRKSNSFYHLVNIVIKYKEEIIMDQEQIPQIIFNEIDQSKTKGQKNGRELNLIRNQLLKICCQKESPNYLKAGILKILSLVNTFDILENISNLGIEELEQNSVEIKSFSAKIIGHVVVKISPGVINKLNFNSSTWKFIESLIKNDKTLIYNDEDEKITPASLILRQLDKEVFSALEDKEVIKKLLDIIIEISVNAQDPEVLPSASKIFKHIDLDSEWVKDELTSMRDVQSPKADAAKRKRRIGIVPTIDILDTLEWKKGVAVLEFIQDKKKIRNIDQMLPILFDLLKRCLDFDEQSAVEYPKQLLLSLILHCCLKSVAQIPDNVFNVELIVQCIRISQNPQTHHHALLVLAHTAHLIPNQVLHHMMAIFTFMGSSVLRHDDAYSFQIISKIIDTIIPIIINEEQSDNQIGNISTVLRVFVDALLDIPEHRRMALLKQLLERIDVKENLYIFLLLIFETQVTHAAMDQQRKESIQKRLDIASEICREFSPQIVIYNTIKLVKYLHELPDERDENMEVDDAESKALNISTRTPKDFRHYKYILVKFTANLLGSPEFVNLVAALNDEDELSLEPLFKDLIVNIIRYVQRISKVAEKSSNTPQAQYWKVMLHLSYDILDSVNALVTSQMFILVTKGLMTHNLATVRRRILELLNNKLQYNEQFFEDCKKNDIYSLIPSIITIVEGLEEDIDNDQEILIQTALLSLKLLIKLLAFKEPEKFLQILEFISSILISGKAHNNVLASVVLCLAELCVNLRGHAISSLPDFMPPLLKILKKQKHEEASSVLLKSVVTTIEKILDSMPLFLSPYLEKLLTEVSILMSKWSVSEEEQKIQSFTTKLNSIKQKIGSTVPLRVLLPPVESCYNTLVMKKCFNVTSSLMNILAESISNASSNDINSNLNDLTNFFLHTLKFRTDNACNLEEANMVENHIVSAFTVLILKLSESTFRPLYYKLYDWAARSEVKSERLITFYSLSSKIALSLKGLFVLFAGHFINNAADILDSCNKVKNDVLCFEDDSKNLLLLENVLTTLDAVFLYDSHKFINRDRFDILMQPLVDQLENTLGGIDELMKRNTTLITPCLVHFSIATADDALWKQMNYQIMLKMRHNSAQIRLATLHCVTEIVRKLGEDFLPLLPEAIPFLAELLEDEEEDVEKACQKAVQEMEKVLGEPLQKYF